MGLIELGMIEAPKSLINACTKLSWSIALSAPACATAFSCATSFAGVLTLPSTLNSRRIFLMLSLIYPDTWR